MSQPEQYDVLILGSGGGGKLTAWHNGRSGRRVAVVERQWIGGSCPNVACLPSKNEIHSAEVAHHARDGAAFGVMTGPVKVDMAKVRQRKRDMVDAADRGAFEELQGKRRRIDHGNGALSCAENPRGEPE